MLKKYETIFIVRPDMGEERTKEVVAKFKQFIETSTELDVFDEWGKRRLAYPIEECNEGYYVLSTFSAEPNFPAELERLYKISEDIIKFITVKKDN